MFDLENFSYIKTIQPFEWVMLGIYTLLIMGITFFIQVTNIRKNPLYRYYSLAVLAKIFSSIVFCLIYIYYYNGGDTVSYYESSRALVNMGMKNPSNYIQLVTESPSIANYLLFDGQTGYPWEFMYMDSQTWFVAKMLSPILFVSFKSYLVSSIVLSWLSFFGSWKLFQMLCRYYPGLEKRMAFCLLFMPSVLFWGSGILKDTFTFSAVAWFIVGVDGAFITKNAKWKSRIIILLAGYVILSIKPYILISLLPGALVWILFTRISKMRSRLLKYVALPAIYLMSFGIGYFGLSALGDRLGKFSIEKMLKTASITQNDLHQDYYGGSSFDIGSFEPTLPGIISKAPAALTVGLFRPFLWEARNVVMIVSGLENSIYLALTLALLYRVLLDPKKFFAALVDNPFIIFLLSYTVLFSIMVGLSTSNFGALVRFKIPFLPSFVCALFVLNYILALKKPFVPPTPQKKRRIEPARPGQPQRIYVEKGSV